MVNRFDHLACAVFLLSLFFSVSKVDASTLTRNGTFDTDISKWSVSGSCGAGSWDSFSGHTGGALAINCFSSSTIGEVSQCVSVPSVETAVNFSAEVANNGASGPITFGLSAYASADCSGAPTTLLGPADTTVVPIDTCCGAFWTTFSRANMILPVTTLSVSIEITVLSPADIVIDNVRLNSGIFQNEFELGE